MGAGTPLSLGDSACASPASAKAEGPTESAVAEPARKRRLDSGEVCGLWKFMCGSNLVAKEVMTPDDLGSIHWTMVLPDTLVSVFALAAHGKSSLNVT
jgi:hypothetical protein